MTSAIVTAPTVQATKGFTDVDDTKFGRPRNYWWLC